MAILDACFLVAIQRKDPGALRVWEALTGAAEPLTVPAAAWVEYLSFFGDASRAQAAKELEASVRFEAFSREAADEAARLQSELRRLGRPMGWHDLQVAATARLLRAEVVTTDDAFREVPGLARRTF